MSEIQSPRHHLPFLAVGQAQKEITHNEALLLTDALLFASVESELSVPPTLAAETNTGKCWLIGAGATGIWLSKVGQVAVWTGGSWRYLLPIDGMCIWNNANSTRIFRRDGAWFTSAAIPDPTGGSFIDIEVRAAVAAILQLSASKRQLDAVVYQLLRQRTLNFLQKGKNGDILATVGDKLGLHRIITFGRKSFSNLFLIYKKGKVDA